MKNSENIENDDDEISIDFSKITNIFKKKKKESSKSINKDLENINSEIKEVGNDINQDIKEEKIKIKELKKEEFDQQENLDDLEEEKEKLSDVKDIIGQEKEKIKVLEEERSDIESLEKKESKIIAKEEQKLENIKKEIKDIEEKRSISSDDEDEELSLDLSKVKNFFKKLTTEEKSKLSSQDSQEKSRFQKSRTEDIFNDEEKDKDEEDISVDFKGTLRSASNFFKGNRWAIPILLILIAISFSTFFRMYPSDLPVTDSWAQDSVYSYYKSQIESQVNKQYPNLPDANKQSLIKNNFNELLKNQKTQIEQQIEATSNQFKSKFQYTAENGKDYTYLLAIDPYLWFGEAKNYLENGHFGTEVVDGKDINFLRNGKEGREMPRIELHSYFGAILYKITSIFSDAPLMAIFFIIPVLIISASIIPAFFIGRKIGGNLGGFFAAMIIAINSALLSRTPAGFSDTDAYNIFFPLMIMWLFLEAFEAKDLKKKSIYAGLSGLYVGLFSYSWLGWWYVFDFILAMIGIYAVYLIAISIKTNNNLSFDSLKELGILGTIFLLVSGLIVSLLQGFSMFILAFKSPLNIINLKDVGVSSLWPNVLTTVAEFNEVPLKTIISQMGGNLLFFIAIIGIVFTLIKKNKESQRNIKYSILLLVWFIGTLYGFTKGIRFGILMVPAFAIAFGAGAGIIYDYLSRWASKELKININISKAVLIILFSLLLISPLRSAHATAMGEIPSMNDAWYESLESIKDDCEDGIITSWWDFGHWFVAIAERRVTFDGADQGERIHWVGKSLLTDDEKESIGILRMLNCGQEKAPHILEGYLEGDTVRAIDLLDDIIIMDKDDAKVTLEKEGLTEKQIDEVLETTHCTDLIDQYYITSEDMIGKANVWAHFGGWDFERAKMWQSASKLSYSDGISTLMEDFNLTEEQADKYYYEIQNTEADRWISSWPGYVGGLAGCQQDEGILICGNGLEVDMETRSATVQTQQGKVSVSSLAYLNSQTKEFEVIEFNGTIAPYSAALIPSGNGAKSLLMSPELAGSMFTRLFFFDGHGLEHFTSLSEKTQVTGGKIQVWKVGWEPGEAIDTLSLPESLAEEEIKASHILITTEQRTDEEALGLIDDITSKLKDNSNITFAELAEEYSECPSASKGGDLGWFKRGSMVQEFESAAFSLDIGEISEPVKTDFGYHLILLEDRKTVKEETVQIKDTDKTDLGVKESETSEETDLSENEPSEKIDAGSEENSEDQEDTSSDELEFEIEI